MKKNNLYLVIFAIFIVKSFGQINPVQNLTWSQEYISPHNNFYLNWEEPLQPHDLLVGYNVYRNGELYRFQTETTLYGYYSQVFTTFLTNCNTNFLVIENQNPPNFNGFEVYVKAVYNPGGIESNYNNSYQTYGPALNIDNYKLQETKIYPNPTKGLLNIENIKAEKIIVYDITGKELKEFYFKTQIDLSEFSKGFYIIKVFSTENITTNKIIKE